MSIFYSANNNSKSEAEEEFLRLKIMTKMKLMESEYKDPDTITQKELENAIIFAQVLNYLLGDKLGANPNTPRETLTYIESIKHDIPFYAHQAMMHQNIYVPVMFVLLRQESLYLDKYGKQYLTSRQGKLTVHHINKYNPNREPVNEGAIILFLRSFQQSNK